MSEEGGRGTNWVDGVTPVNAANMNKLEDAILALSQRIRELEQQKVTETTIDCGTL